MVIAHLPIFRHVAAGLTHQPDGRIRRGLAAARLQKGMVPEMGTRRIARIEAASLRSHLHHRCRTLEFENRVGARRCLFDQVPELRMLGFEVGGNSPDAQLFRAHRSDRSDDHVGQPVPNRVADSLGVSHLHHAAHLLELVKRATSAFVFATAQSIVQGARDQSAGPIDRPARS